eukprot:358752-Chlamydomonas_euryale.AAC.7
MHAKGPRGAPGAEHIALRYQAKPGNRHLHRRPCRLEELQHRTLGRRSTQACCASLLDQLAIADDRIQVAPYLCEDFATATLQVANLT